MESKRDYYEVLGVSRSADAEAIRSAHRRLARTYHPDINKDEHASKKFSEIQEAYDVLSDPEKRSQFDQFGHTAGRASPYGPSGGAPGGWSNVDSDTFEDIFGGAFGGRRRGASGFGDFGAQAPRGPVKGPDVNLERDIGFATAIFGGTEELRMNFADGDLSTLTVTIPAGANDGAVLRVRGKGNPGVDGGPAGDLLLRLRVGAHPWFKRDDLDLSVNVPISITEASLGAKIEVPLPKGTATITIPAGVVSGSKLRLKGKGITNSKGTSGNLYAIIEIVAPSELSDSDKEALEAIAPNLPNPRATVAWAGEVTD
jgi:curved DNA-binding protein